MYRFGFEKMIGSPNDYTDITIKVNADNFQEAEKKIKSLGLTKGLKFRLVYVEEI